MNVASYSVVNTKMEIDGQSYTNGITINGFNSGFPEQKQTYNLNGQYRSLNINYGSLDKAKDGASAKITIIGDGVEVWSSTAVKGVPLQSASIPISGVLKMEILFTALTNGFVYPAIVNPILTK